MRIQVVLFLFELPKRNAMRFHVKKSRKMQIGKVLTIGLRAILDTFLKLFLCAWYKFLSVKRFCTVVGSKPFVSRCNGVLMLLDFRKFLNFI